MYLWLIVVGTFAAFAYGWGTGSNDVANAFGTSVGAKTLTLKQAVIIAAVFNFVGAVVLGRVSTSTIANGIANINVFYREPEIYAYGMICALTTGFVWQALASYYELNVSATHSIIGAIIGFSFVYGGSGAVNWATPDKAVFPPYRGVVPIILAWFVSPVLTGLASVIIFLIVRTLVLRRANSYMLSFWVLPFMVMLTTWINIYFIFTRGAKKMLTEKQGDNWSDSKAAWISAICAGGLTFLTIIIVLPLLKWKADKKFRDDAEKAKAAADEEANKAKEDEAAEGAGGQTNSKFLKACKSIRDVAMYGMEVDVHKVVEEDPIVAAIHANAEVFDPKAEYAFSYLQVFSAICVIFAHGAGEVGYMAGPLTTIWYAVKDGILPSKVNAPIWTIMISALGLVTGLATYGYKVTRAVGMRYAKLSPTRGFAAELATALVIMIAAQYGLPTSSSQCITGGIVGLGMLEGKSGVNWKFLGITFISWGLTLFVVALSTAALFAQGVFAPSMSCNNLVRVYEDNVVGIGRSMARDMNSTLYAFKNASDAGNLVRLNNTRWSSLNRSINSFVRTGNTWLTPRTVGTIKVNDAVDYLARAVALVQENTLVTLGQEQNFAGAAMCNGPNFDPASPNFTNACPALRVLRNMPAPVNATRWS
ncbi:hypothetical protein GPECTOR_14g33 [Gonium pectorale]|uniref:Phosphate transporter n=1 Tax=Gonium pectorale TaxID=33097 RepID=A0A150GMG1_GONPE|nr:hypothetical protein GPECTOR_14g33 [Gonium pectorale]|eukprot:KXZ51046.1 hypothetical protein GPECTOR_14g33 [Gonium pectorale]